MHYRLLDIQRQKVNNPLKVRSIIAMCYNANKEIQRKLFKTVVSFSEEQVEAFKTIFEKGNIVKEENVHGAYRRIEVYENNLLVKKTIIWGDDTTVTLYQYNADDLLVKTTKYKENKELTDDNIGEQTIYEYNCYKDCIKQTMVEKPSEIYSHTKYAVESKWEYKSPVRGGEYIKTCHSVTTYVYRDTWGNKWKPERSIKTIIYGYDSSGKLVRYNEFDGDNNPTQIEINEYRGNLLVKRIMEGGKEEIRRYNEHEDVIYHKRYQTETTFRNGVTTNYILVIRNMEYKYDRYGNWIECRCYDENGDYSELFTRQIEYIE